MPARILLLLLVAEVSPLPFLHAPEALPVEEIDSSDGARMFMIYKKGFLFIRVDVLDLDIRFGEGNGREISSLAGQGEVTSAVADSIAALAIASRDVMISIEFLRDIALGKFISEARKATQRVWKQGFIDKEEFTRVERGLPVWYKSLEERGIRSGDRMFYRIRGDSLHTVFEGKDGRLFVNQVDEGSGPQRAVLGGYFARGSDFREGLIQSLADGAGDQ